MNSGLIQIAHEMELMLSKLGQQHRSNAYKKAASALENLQTDINDPEDLNGIQNIGTGIKQKLIEYMETGKIAYLEEIKNTPKIIFTNIYGIGPKKADELEKSGIKSINELIHASSNDATLVNDKQKIGLKYYNDIMERIPRAEIAQFDKILKEQVTPDTHLKYEIVGSYRRGAETSGDIDVIFTSTNSQSNQERLFKNIIAKH